MELSGNPGSLLIQAPLKPYVRVSSHTVQAYESQSSASWSRWKVAFLCKLLWLSGHLNPCL